MQLRAKGWNRTWSMNDLMNHFKYWLDILYGLGMLTRCSQNSLSVSVGANDDCCINLKDFNKRVYVTLVHKESMSQ